MPALYAATSPKSSDGGFYGPSGLAHLGGGPADQKLSSRLRSEADAARMWDLSERLTGVSFSE